MKRTTLPQTDLQWLSDTFARNRAAYGGFSMEADGEGDTGDAGGDDSGSDAGESDKGYPANTPVRDMTVDQKASYYEHQARKHEDRNKDLLRITGGKYGDDLKTLLQERETLLNEKRTDSERAVEDAKKTVREETLREIGPKSVRAAFELLLDNMDEQERNDAIDLLDLSKFLNESGEVDTAKVRKFAGTITAPAAKDTGNQGRDYGAGRRGQQSKSGVSAGADLYASTRKKSASST